MESVPQPAPQTTDDLPATHRVRPWLTAWVAVLTELVVFAALDNQLVVRSLRNHVSGKVADYIRGAVDAATMFGWRFAPANGQSTHVWAAQFAGIGTLVVLTLLGTAIVSRGAGGFWRVLVSVWALVTALAPIAIMVRNVVVVPSAPGPLQSRVGQAAYGYGSFGAAVVAGVVLGLLTGVVAALVARFARRRLEVAGQPEYTEQDYAARGYADREYANRQYIDREYHQDAQLPPRYDTESTTQLPRYDSPYAQAPGVAGGPPAYDPASAGVAPSAAPPAAPYVRDQPERPLERRPEPDEQFRTAAIPPVDDPRAARPDEPRAAEPPAEPVAGQPVAPGEPAPPRAVGVQPPGVQPPGVQPPGDETPAERTAQYEPVRIDDEAGDYLPAGQHDAGQHDAGQHDAGQHDAGHHDAGQHDAGQHDSRYDDAQADYAQGEAVRQQEGRRRSDANQVGGSDER
jgi:hypothetical protein